MGYRIKKTNYLCRKILYLLMNDLQKEGLINELKIKGIRSSGPGGQNVNKVSSKVELRFDLYKSNYLGEEEKQRIAKKYKNTINSEGVFILTEQSSRSQFSNKIKVINRFFFLLKEAMRPIKKRLPTQPSKQSIQKRLKNKKIIAEKKRQRKLFE